MSDSALRALGPRETLALLETSRAARTRSECDDLVVVAHWADLHPPELLDGRPVVRGMERAIRLGGEGTPPVTEFAAVEVGSVLRLGDRQARELIADVLDLRHRLPGLWELVLAGVAPVERVREIAKRTRTLSCDAAGKVDHEIGGFVISLSWERLFDAVDAAILRADPERAERLARRARGERFVRISRRSRHGTRSVHARIDADYAVWMQATIDALTGVITNPDGPPEGVADRHCEGPEEFQAQAFGLTGQPLLASWLLAQGRQPDLFSTDDPRPAEDAAVDDHPHDVPGAARPAPPSPDGPVGFDVDHGDLRRVPIPLDPDPRFDRESAFWLARIDPNKLLPRVVLHVHISAETAACGQGVARVEGIGPVLASQVRDWLGTGCRIRLQPVVDLEDVHPVDGYEVPDGMRNALLLRTPASCFPYSSNRSRGMQPDHTIAFRRTGGRRPSGGKAPPGQTWLNNLGPVGVTEHRIKTHGGWSVRQPVPGSYVWRTRYGRVLIVNDSGTHDLGDSSFSRAVWQAALDASRSDASRSDVSIIDDRPCRSDIERRVARWLEVA